MSDDDVYSHVSPHVMTWLVHVSSGNHSTFQGELEL
jgi:hypothetical protein